MENKKLSSGTARPVKNGISIMRVECQDPAATYVCQSARRLRPSHSIPYCMYPCWSCASALRSSKYTKRKNSYFIFIFFHFGVFKIRRKEALRAPVGR